MAEVFGKSNLQVLIYRRDGDLYPEFIEKVIGSASFASDSLGLNEPVNASLPMYATECLRFLHRMAHTDGRQDRMVIAMRFMRYYADPSSAADRQRLRSLFDERARSVDLGRVDQAFHHLDREVMSKYASNVRNAAPNGGFPESEVTDVRYLQDDEASTAMTSDISSRESTRGSFARERTTQRALPCGAHPCVDQETQPRDQTEQISRPRRQRHTGFGIAPPA
jgi:hypothetical protein